MTAADFLADGKKQVSHSKHQANCRKKCKATGDVTMVTVFRSYYGLSFKLNTEKNANERKIFSFTHHCWGVDCTDLHCVQNVHESRFTVSRFLASVKEVLVRTTQHMLVTAFRLQ